jgi:histidine ammonia-lyase
VLAIELLAACQALDLRAPLVASGGVEAARRAVRERIPFMDEDRMLAPDIDAAEKLLGDPEFLKRVESACGKLQ